MKKKILVITLLFCLLINLSPTPSYAAPVVVSAGETLLLELMTVLGTEVVNEEFEKQGFTYEWDYLIWDKQRNDALVEELSNQSKMFLDAVTQEGFDLQDDFETMKALYGVTFSNFTEELNYKKDVMYTRITDTITGEQFSRRLMLESANRHLVMGYQEIKSHLPTDQADVLSDTLTSADEYIISDLDNISVAEQTTDIDVYNSSEVGFLDSTSGEVSTNPKSQYWSPDVLDYGSMTDKSKYDVGNLYRNDPLPNGINYSDNPNDSKDTHFDKRYSLSELQDMNLTPNTIFKYCRLGFVATDFTHDGLTKTRVYIPVEVQKKNGSWDIENGRIYQNARALYLTDDSLEWRLPTSSDTTWSYIQASFNEVDGTMYFDLNIKGYDGFLSKTFINLEPPNFGNGWNAETSHSLVSIIQYVNDQIPIIYEGTFTDILVNEQWKYGQIRYGHFSDSNRSKWSSSYLEGLFDVERTYSEVDGARPIDNPYDFVNDTTGGVSTDAPQNVTVNVDIDLDGVNQRIDTTNNWLYNIRLTILNLLNQFKSLDDDFSSFIYNYKENNKSLSETLATTNTGIGDVKTSVDDVKTSVDGVNNTITSSTESLSNDISTLNDSINTGVASMNEYLKDIESHTNSSYLSDDTMIEQNRFWHEQFLEKYLPELKESIENIDAGSGSSTGGGSGVSDLEDYLIDYDDYLTDIVNSTEYNGDTLDDIYDTLESINDNLSGSEDGEYDYTKVIPAAPPIPLEVVQGHYMNIFQKELPESITIQDYCKIFHLNPLDFPSPDMVSGYLPMVPDGLTVTYPEPIPEDGTLGIRSLNDILGDFLDKLIERLGILIKSLFIPSEEFMKTTVAQFNTLVMSRFPFIEVFKAFFSTITNMDIDEKLPELYVDLPEFYGGTKVNVLNFSAVPRESFDIVRSFLSYMIWFIFIFRTFKRIPRIIGD